MPVLESATQTNDIPMIPMKIEQGDKSVTPLPFVTTELATTARTISPASIFTPSMAEFLANSFLPLLPEQKEILGVYWYHEEGTIRIWTVIDEPNSSLEEKICQAQLKFMDKHANLTYDFSVIYLFGKPMKTVVPSEAISVSRK